ncbi:calcium-binding protein [Streptomyces lincolnensis]|uniref:Calcium-binding protein n=1 Tax=Streptomyces lincolnensis TaxID=1915 RepID=A0A1B1M945_STRLN|nr:SMP-30/gluconolactonase/LRE family protein [Streptomyces lincolnensis]ANS65003.1 calcium-binding protein [Streptomyces lincolnensis]AXG56789.1 calcium-binding protein [Streptomyces lincolnensis]QMV06795.1 SMP-30/gluconolactonase/LRE family protein [Streptomyces lincolnensis]
MTSNVHTTSSYEVAVRAEATLGEGPTWDAAAGRLIWIDILGCRVHTYDPVSGRRTSRTTEQHVGAVKPRVGGGLVLNLRDGVGLVDPDDTFRWLHRAPVAGRRANDAAVAPDGSLWAGTMRYDEAAGGGSLSRLTGDGTVEVVLSDVAVSNGTGWSPDGRSMYYVDSPTRRVDVFDFTDDGRAVNRRPFVSIEDGGGFPDGLTVDADGCVWVALWDGSAVRRYTPDGVLDRVLSLPTPRVTACAFGGPDLTDLYITTARTGLSAPHPTAGSLLVVPDAGRGVVQPSFAG